MIEAIELPMMAMSESFSLLKKVPGLSSDTESRKHLSVYEANAVDACRIDNGEVRGILKVGVDSGPTLVMACSSSLRPSLCSGRIAPVASNTSTALWYLAFSTRSLN